jgi:hypothetical protein
MNFSAIIAVLSVVIQELPGAITTVMQLKDIAVKAFASLNDGRLPTDEEMDQLAKEIDVLVAEALKPLQRD